MSDNQPNPLPDQSMDDAILDEDLTEVAGGVAGGMPTQVLSNSEALAIDAPGGIFEPEPTLPSPSGSEEVL